MQTNTTQKSRQRKTTLVQSSGMALGQETTGLFYTVSQKNKQNYFCYNYVKFPPNPTSFGTKMANKII